MKQFRNTGAKGALLDEYEKALNELKDLIASITSTELTIIVDAQTTDPDCKSIQTVLTHVIRAGYNYVNEIRKSQGETVSFYKSEVLHSTNAYIEALDTMFKYNVALFNAYPNIEIETLDDTKKMFVSWGHRYDIEQLLEHAIVHILRHRRQIERFLIDLRA